MCNTVDISLNYKQSQLLIQRHRNLKQSMNTRHMTNPSRPASIQYSHCLHMPGDGMYMRNIPSTWPGKITNRVAKIGGDRIRTCEALAIGDWRKFKTNQITAIGHLQTWRISGRYESIIYCIHMYRPAILLTSHSTSQSCVMLSLWPVLPELANRPFVLH